jgi:hypothetical protein
MQMLLLLIACLHRPAPVEAPAQAPPPPPPPQELPASKGELEQNIARLLPLVEQGDQLDRLIVLQELMIQSHSLDPRSQELIDRSVEKWLAIEQRSLPMPVAEADALPTISTLSAEDFPPIPPTVAERMQVARQTMAAGKWLEAEALLEGMSETEAVALRLQIQGEWLLRKNSEITGLYQSALRMVPGAGRQETMQQLAGQLQAAIARFPAHPEAESLRGLLRDVQAESGSAP